MRRSKWPKCQLSTASGLAPLPGSGLAEWPVFLNVAAVPVPLKAHRLAQCPALDGVDHRRAMFFKKQFTSALVALGVSRRRLGRGACAAGLHFRSARGAKRFRWRPRRQPLVVRPNAQIRCRDPQHPWYPALPKKRVRRDSTAHRQTKGNGRSGSRDSHELFVTEFVARICGVKRPG